MTDAVSSIVTGRDGRRLAAISHLSARVFRAGGSCGRYRFARDAGCVGFLRVALLGD